MRWHVALALALGSACGAGGSLAVRPDIKTPPCVDRYVGVPIHSKISWRCEDDQYGGGRWGNKGTCQHAVEATVRCEGVPCLSSVTPQQAWDYWGKREIQVTPLEPGELTVVTELVHAGGFRERHVAPTCQIASTPELTMSCQMRDPATGAYEACPASVKEGTELHVEITARTEVGTPPFPAAWLGDDQDHEVSPRSRRDGIECSARETGDPRRSTMRCTWLPRVGHHVLRGSLPTLRNLSEQRLDVDVR
ncbi:MAG: hypothetical protein ABI867_32475 [Kofleriaceae bacterium]